VHRTVVENDDVYAVRVDDGVLSTPPSRSSTRRHLTAAHRPQAPPPSAARPTRSTTRSTRSPPAPPVVARSNCASTARCATAPYDCRFGRPAGPRSATRVRARRRRARG